MCMFNVKAYAEVKHRQETHHWSVCVCVSTCSFCCKITTSQKPLLSHRDIYTSPDNRISTLKRTMRTARTVCFVCFVLFFGTRHAESNSTEVALNKTETEQTTVIQNTSIKESSTSCETTPRKSNVSNPDCVCAPSSTKTQKGDCIFFLPDGIDHKLILVLVALAVTCFILLLTTLICACQLCHMKVMISRFRPHHSNIDLQAMRKRSKSPCRDDSRPVGEPTETCLMLSEVSTQEAENKEESVQPNTEPYVEGPNGEVAQESGNGCEAESKEPDVEAPESSAIEV